jgi:hypothetical protein
MDARAHVHDNPRMEGIGITLAVKRPNMPITIVVAV